MRTFICLFKDERYSVPTLSFYFTEDEQRAVELASRDLSANPHYESFEISEDGRPLFLQRGTDDRRQDSPRERRA